MPGIEEWDFGGKGWDDWPVPSVDDDYVRGRWGRGRERGLGSRPWDASKIFKVYAEFHEQVMANASLWSSNNFVIYRTMDRGMGNQLESLVSSYVLALLTNRCRASYPQIGDWL